MALKILEERIKKEGIVIDDEILKVDSFLNHQIDVNLLKEVSSYLSSEFKGITKIITIETSGIAFAIGVSECLNNVPVVFAKKSKSKILDMNSVYSASIKSFTRKIDSTVYIDKRFINENDVCLIVDDFLAEGNASLGLLNILNQAKAKVAGVAVVIEKCNQGGRKALEEKGLKVVSGASIDSFKDGKVIFSK